jgi:hypothetical protein
VVVWLTLAAIAVVAAIGYRAVERRAAGRDGVAGAARATEPIA